MEFHISRLAREKYRFDEELFSYDGNVIFANFHAVRRFVQKLNDQRDLSTYPEQAAKTGQVNAMGLIDEIFHHIFHLYREQKKPDILHELLLYLESRFTPAGIDSFLKEFVEEYPPLEVYKNKSSAELYLASKTAGISHRELVLEELIMLWLTEANPALDNYRDLFAETNFVHDPRYSQFIHEVEQFFQQQPPFGPANTSLVHMLRTPALEVPDSITGQLQYIQEHWSTLLGEYLYRLLTSLDLIKEENKMSFTGAGPVPIPVYDLEEFRRAGGSGFEVEAFSQDREWMPRLVLIAKNSYVWLDQLSRKYQTEIRRLDQIPDAEIETLARWGITGLWLIGLWERSPASARIKQLCGNPEAISSAYSLYAYRIAADLGGESAYEKLRDQAAHYGIRLASDMVPNHMGIDSEWVIHHPDRFLSLDQCPYPSYRFTGENLSADPNVSIQIEDHYFDRTDAAVVFRRQDLRSNDIRFIYHGNDGTTMPWNDTAQLNYLNPEVREAVIQTILEVARKFPIIRFDAAMTLAKKHYQRLWFPQPGTGGAIPSRAEHSMSSEEFNRAMPDEFWREVVDRVAVEAPDTLLLAEAFWLMEGYFVRTLGMHRVYNSAFMNMMRNEDNAGYHKLLRNTLEFEPEILKRYVNFMNNPDERTAVDQFGKGDKYFGVCLMMVTMPGLPMLGHGQIEGFSEKYGMEFRKAYWDEQVDQDLVNRHEQEIFPLLHLRKLFAGIDQFNLYNFVTSDGSTNENVYAYSNADSGQKALILYNNNIQSTEGWIHDSVPQLRGHGQNRSLAQISLTQALSLPDDREAYLVFRDSITHLQYLRPFGEVLDRGLHFKLRGYQYHALLDFQVVRQDPRHDYRALYQVLGSQGVPDLQQALDELVMRPILEPYREMVNAGYLGYLLAKYTALTKIATLDEQEISQKVERFLTGASQREGLYHNITPVRDEITGLITTGLTLQARLESILSPGSRKIHQLIDLLTTPLFQEKSQRTTLLVWAICSPLGKLKSDLEGSEYSLTWLYEWKLTHPFVTVLRDWGTPEERIQELLQILRIAIKHQNWYSELQKSPFDKIVQSWFSDPEVQNYLRVNRFQDVLWYRRESFDEFIAWMTLITTVKTLADKQMDRASLTETLLHLYEITARLRKLEAQSKYRFDHLLNFKSE